MRLRSQQSKTRGHVDHNMICSLMVDTKAFTKSFLSCKISFLTELDLIHGENKVLRKTRKTGFC